MRDRTRSESHERKHTEKVDKKSHRVDLLTFISFCQHNLIAFL